MGLTVMKKVSFVSRYGLDVHQLIRDGVVRWVPGHGPEEADSSWDLEVEFDEEEIAALAAEERLRDKPSLQQHIEDSLGHSLAQFVGMKMSDAGRQLAVATVVKILDRHGTVDGLTIDGANTDAPRVRVDLTLPDGERVALDLELKLNG